MSIKALVFDFGNVVGCFNHRRTTERLAPHAQLAADELHQLLYSGPLAERYEMGDITTEGFRSEVKRTGGVACSGDLLDDPYSGIFWAQCAPFELLTQLAPPLS